jgi:predicted dienelactone hydrolase
VTSTYPHALARVWAAIGVVVAVVVTAAIVLPPAVARTSPAGGREPVTFSLPAPTGPEQVGTLELHLIDQDRTDPWDDAGGPRELMISIWYSADHDPRAPATPYLQPRIASYYNQTLAELGIAEDAVDWAGAVTHAQTRAEVAAGDPRPLVIYSPGGGVPRALGTTLVEDLVSHGYVVVTVDSTYQAPVEFPDGTTRMPAHDVDLKQALAERVKDIRFVLDQLALIEAGGNPDVEQRALPDGLGAQLDLDRIGMFGHSIGGFAAAETMQVDDRVRAGVNLDGSMGEEYRGSSDTMIERPFLLFGAGTDGDSDRPHNHIGAPDWASYWKLMTGWKRDLYLATGEHMSFSDFQSVIPAIGAEIDLDEEDVRDAIGTVDPAQSLTLQRRYLLAFLDQHLRDLPQPILDTVPADLSIAELIT